MNGGSCLLNGGYSLGKAKGMFQMREFKQDSKGQESILLRLIFKDTLLGTVGMTLNSVHFKDEKKCRRQSGGLGGLPLQKQSRLNHGNQAMILGTLPEK